MEVTIKLRKKISQKVLFQIVDFDYIMRIRTKIDVNVLPIIKYTLFKFSLGTPVTFIPSIHLFICSINSQHKLLSTFQFESNSLIIITNTTIWRRWDLLHGERPRKTRLLLETQYLVKCQIKINPHLLQFGNPFSALCICFLYHSVNLISTFHSTWPRTTQRRNFYFFIFEFHDYLIVTLTHNTSVVRILFHSIQQDSYRKRRHSFTPCDFQTNKTIN